MNESENFSQTPWQSATDPTLRVTDTEDEAAEGKITDNWSAPVCWDTVYTSTRSAF